MASVLLDFPWSLSAALNRFSPASGVLNIFDKVRSSYRLELVPFISQEEFLEFCARIPRSGANNLAPVLRFINHCIRTQNGVRAAVPTPTPPHITEAWKRSLRDSMGELDDWRNPQILFTKLLPGRWPRTSDEIEVWFELCAAEASSGPHLRSIVCLEAYAAHPFSLSDFDPWDLRRVYPPNTGAPVHQLHPCRLPKPGILDGVSLENLTEKLGEIPDWQIGGRFYFLPPAGWTAQGVSKQLWRQGRAFSHGNLNGNSRGGPLDRKGEPWSWDQTHRHWDVQLSQGGYLSISHDGHLIKDKST